MKAYGPGIIWPPSMNAAGTRPRLGNSIASCCAAATLTTSTGVCNNGWALSITSRRDDRPMRQFCFLLLCVISLPVTVSVAQIYRWTDETGRVHFTNNPDTIPPDRRPDSRPLPPDMPATPPPASVAPPVSPPSAPVPAGAQSAAATGMSSLQQKAEALEQHIAAAQQERQHLLDELKGVRPIRMNPAFGRERRRVDEMGRALAAIEIQLDTLYAELQNILQQQIAEEESVRSLTSSPPREVIQDNQGHNQNYWQQRLRTLRERLQQARQQRQIILEQLGAELPEDRSFGRRGQEVLQLVQALEQLDQEIHTAETDLQALLRQSANAGAPAAWLR